MDMDFESAHRLFLDTHLQERIGERRDRLQRGHREAEKLFCQNVWWPLLHSFDHLHPEYEVTDWRGLHYFCDFLWSTPYVKLVIEIKGFGPHVQDMDRRKFCRELNRETFLTAMGFHVVSFAYDDVAQRPDLCMTLLRMVLGRYRTSLLDEDSPDRRHAFIHREIVRLASTLGRPIRPIDVRNHLGVNYRTAAEALHTLCEKKALKSETGEQGSQVVRYLLNDAGAGYL